jgi:hypothetical protein
VLAPGLPAFGLSRSSPSGFEKNLHPLGSIFTKNLDNPAPHTKKNAFSFLFFPFFFSLLKMNYVRKSDKFYCRMPEVNLLICKEKHPDATASRITTLHSY